jgi:hypothetical protein
MLRVSIGLSQNVLFFRIRSGGAFAAAGLERVNAVNGVFRPAGFFLVRACAATSAFSNPRAAAPFFYDPQHSFEEPSPVIRIALALSPRK